VKANVRTMAKEMMEQTKNSILAQASQAVYGKIKVQSFAKEKCRVLH
jgi:hypothetical protein